MQQPFALTFPAITATDLPALTRTMTRAFTAAYRPSAAHDAGSLAPYTTDAFFARGWPAVSISHATKSWLTTS